MRLLRKRNLIYLFLVLLIVSSCAPSGYTIEPSGFLSGIWHGICIPFAVIGKIFGADIGITASHNTGTFYWVGVLIGIGGLGSSAFVSK